MRMLTPTIMTACFWMMTSPAFAGAGGTQGENDKSWIAILLLLPLILGFMVYRSIMKSFARRAAGNVLRSAAHRDIAWDQNLLKQRAQYVFMELQQRWSSNDIDGSKPLVHPNYQDTYLAQLRGIIDAGHRNQITDIRISNVEIILAKDYAENDRDMFVALIHGQMNDALYSQDGRLIRNQGNDRKGENAQRMIREYWSFQRQGDEWLLSNISQSHDAVNDEVSIDAESLAQKHQDPAQLQQAVAKAESRKQRLKSAQKTLAFSAGATVTVFGYFLYYLFFRSLFRMVAGWF